MPAGDKGTKEYKVKILFVLEYYFPNIGGVERLFKSLTEHLAANHFEVMVLTNRFSNKLKRSETINGVKVRRLNFRNRYLFTFLSLPWVVYYARRFDLIHTTSYNAALPAFLAAKLTGKKSVITFHEAWGKLWFKLPFINPISKTFFYLYEKLILRLPFTRFIAVSDYTRDCLVKSGVRTKQVVRIYNGLAYSTFSKFSHTPPAKFTFTFFGRLGPSKGFDILMQAASVFLDQNPDCLMKLIITKQPAHILKYIQRTIVKNKIENQVSILHHLSDHALIDELIRSSCVVIPSVSEGFCFAAAECVAMGIPVISSGKGALKEVVSGKFVQMGSYETDSLIKALILAKENKWENKTVRKFELGLCLENYRKLYDELI